MPSAREELEAAVAAVVAAHHGHCCGDDARACSYYEGMLEGADLAIDAVLGHPKLLDVLVETRRVESLGWVNESRIIHEKGYYCQLRDNCAPAYVERPAN